METPTSQIQSLNSALSTLSRVRTSLPSLLRSFAVPTLSSSERATIYHDRSTEASSSISSLNSQLKSIQHILDQTLQSELEDPVGIVVQEREEGTAGDLWRRLGEVLKREKVGAGEFVGGLESPKTPEELRELVSGWMERNQRVKVGLEPSDGREEQWELKFVLRGTMRAVVMLHWSDVDEEGGAGGERMVQVERVACFGLKEDRASYLQSQYNLFQSISATAMETVSRSLRKLETAEKPISNVEEVLTLLSNPPLPF
ncbi:hypothetical protein P7C70_g9471, partial [Phenoliferia sp. Uapishka_3]